MCPSVHPLVVWSVTPALKTALFTRRDVTHKMKCTLSLSRFRHPHPTTLTPHTYSQGASKMLVSPLFDSLLRTNELMDQWTDQRADKAFYRAAWPQLKNRFFGKYMILHSFLSVLGRNFGLFCSCSMSETPTSHILFNLLHKV